MRFRGAYCYRGWMLRCRFVIALWLIAPPASAASPEVVAEAAQRAGHHYPWALVLGLALASAVAWRRRRWLRAAFGTQPWRLAFGLAATSVGGLWLAPSGYLHMNGQGPLWTDFALGEPSAYGPGFAELFGWAARAAGAAPERGVFTLHAAMLWSVPLLVFVALRAVRAPLAISTAISTLTALDPMRARLAGSESYYGVGYVLVAAACAVVCVGFTGFSMSRRESRGRGLLGVLAAGALIAQAARAHPYFVGAVCCRPADGARYAGRTAWPVATNGNGCERYRGRGCAAGWWRDVRHDRRT